MSLPSALESQMLDLVNQERTGRGLQPLTFDRLLNDSSEDHSEWMQSSGNFSHRGQGGSSATDRMRDAGFEFRGSWASAENIAYQSERGAPGYEDDVVMLHNALMNSAGHRANILNPRLESIGIGIETGANSYGPYDAVIVTQNFATSAAPNAPIVEFQDVAETPNVPVQDNTSVETVTRPQETVEVVDTPTDTGGSRQPQKEETGPRAPDPDVELPNSLAKALERYQKKAEKFQDRKDGWEARADANPANADRAEKKAETWAARIDAVQNQLENWAEKQVARLERKATRTDDKSDDVVAAQSLTLICEEVDTWKVSWSSEFCDFG